MPVRNSGQVTSEKFGFGRHVGVADGSRQHQ